MAKSKNDSNLFVRLVALILLAILAGGSVRIGNELKKMNEKTEVFTHLEKNFFATTDHIKDISQILQDLYNNNAESNKELLELLGSQIDSLAIEKKEIIKIAYEYPDIVLKSWNRGYFSDSQKRHLSYKELGLEKELVEVIWEGFKKQEKFLLSSKIIDYLERYKKDKVQEAIKKFMHTNIDWFAEYLNWSFHFDKIKEWEKEDAGRVYKFYHEMMIPRTKEAIKIISFIDKQPNAKGIYREAFDLYKASAEDYEGEALGKLKEKYIKSFEQKIRQL